MITKDDILSFGRYKYKQPFFGSCNGMRYKIVHPKVEEGEPDLFHVDVWPEPNCYEKTDESLIVKTTFPFGEEGYEQVLEYLNDKLNDYKTM